MARRGGRDHRAARAGDRIVEQRPQPRHRRDILRLGKRGGIAQRTRQILRAGAVAALLSAGRGERAEIADQQGADPRRPAALVRGKRDEIGGRHAVVVNRGRHLRGIEQQQSAGRMNGIGNRRDRLANARFAVCPLHADERAAPRRQRGIERGHIDQAVTIDRDRFERRPRAQHRIMLDRACQPALDRGAVERDRQRFARPAGQQRFAAPAVSRRDPPARVFQRSARGAPLGVRRRRIGPARHAFANGRARRSGHRRGRGMIQIKTVGQATLRHDCEMIVPAYIATTFFRATARANTSAGPMPEVIFPGPEGRLEGRFAPAPRPRAPVAMILHPHPSSGGTMNNRMVMELYKTFQRRGFATLRFNFRGVGKSQGVFDNGIGELSDAASALDWVQSFHPEAQTTWIAGVSFGAWIGMQLLMRRPEIRGFISIAPPANMYDFTFLAPCPSSGIIIQGEADEVVQPLAVQKLVDKLRTQKHITIHHDVIPRANHFFQDEMPELMQSVDNYLDMRLDPNSPIK